MFTRLSAFRFLTFLLVLLAAVPLALVAGQAQAFNGTETRLSDLWFRTRPRQAPRADLLLVARDEKTLKEMGRPSHADYGAMVRKLKAAGAKLIVLDLDLDDRQSKAADRALWTAIEDSKRTVVMVRYRQDRLNEPDNDEKRGLRALEKSTQWQEFAVDPKSTPQWEWLQFAPATSDFIHSAAGAGVAVTEQSLDPDNVLRRSRAGYVTKILYPVDAKQGALTNYLAVVPSLSTITAVLAMGADPSSLEYRFGDELSFGGSARHPLTTKGFVPVDYAGPEGNYPRVSMVDVIRGEAKPELFKDRIVLIGSTIPTDDLTEYRMTPFGSRMPRVEITANQVQSFLNRRPLVEAHVAGFWSVLMLGVLLGLLVPAFRGVGMLLGGIGALAIYLLIGWAFFMTRSVMLPLLPAFILAPFAIAVGVILGLLMRPYSIAEYVEVRDTGMAVGPGETLPGTPRRRLNPFRRQRGL